MNMDNFNFEKLAEIIQIKTEFKEDTSSFSVLNDYLHLIFDNLLARMESQSEEDDKAITKLIFADYLDLPLIVSEKIFNAFEKKKDTIMTSNEFLKGIKRLYLGSLGELERITFDILCFSKNDKIVINDVMLIFHYLNTITNSDEEIVIPDLEKLINNFFKGKNSLTRKEYEEKLENENSDLFILFLVFLYRKQPFKNESLQYHQQILENFNFVDGCPEKTNENKFNQVFTLQNNKICEPSKEIMTIIKNNFLKITRLRRKKSSTNVLQFKNALPGVSKSESDKNVSHYKEKDDHENLSNFLFSNFEKLDPITFTSRQFTLDRSKRTPSTNINTTSRGNPTFRGNLSSKGVVETISNLINPDYEENTFRFCNTQIHQFNFTNFFSSSIYPEWEIYKISSGQKVEEFKIVLVEKNLFSFRYISNNNKYTLDSISPLNGLFATPCDNLTINRKNFFPFALINKFGNTFTSLTNFYLFENKEQREDCLKKLKFEMNLRGINDYYTLIDKIVAKGEFSEIYLAKEKNENNYFKSENEIVVVKKLKKTNLKTLKDLQMMKNEIDVMNFIKNNKNKNSNIIDVKDFFEDQKFIYIVMEYMNKGNLANLLKSRGSVMPESEVKEIISQIVNGILFLHKNSIIHRDLKPDNILISFIDNNNSSNNFSNENTNNSSNSNKLISTNSNASSKTNDSSHLSSSNSLINNTSEKVDGANNNFIHNFNNNLNTKFIIKISDFSFSRVVGENEKINENNGSCIYNAPEIFLNVFYGKKVDSWSFGVMFYFIVSGIFPFDYMTNNNKSKTENFDKIVNAENKITFPINSAFSYCHSEIKNILKLCLSKFPNQRPDIFQIKELIETKWN